MKRIALHALAILAATTTCAGAADAPVLAGVKRVVFLGDSITYAGQYVEDVEACLRLDDPGLRCEFVNLGLPSETLSGLSEPGHADGAFPRPDLHERLDRVLARAKPDLIVACYGMNDGIYHPFDEARFAKFREGMQFLRDRAAASGARVVHVTPPVFDPEPIRGKTLPAGRDAYPKPFEGYDGVLDRYGAWLIGRRADGWVVVDAHGPLVEALKAGRGRDPKFRLADDGVHINAAGHWIMARAILEALGDRAPGLATAADVEAAVAAYPQGAEVLKLVRRKQRILKDAWLAEVGHKRPGMARGRPFVEAVRDAGWIEGQIRERLAGRR